MPDSSSSPLIGRRLAALLIDWGLSLLVSSAFFPEVGVDRSSVTVVERMLLVGDQWATLAVFAAMNLALVSTLGFTIGHRLAGVRVVRDDGAAVVGLVKAAVRTALILLVIPAVVWDAEGRGLHDKAAGTRVVRLIANGEET